MRARLQADLKLSPGVGVIIVRLDQWATALISDKAMPELPWVSGARDRDGLHFIQVLSDALVGQEDGTHGDLLRKSLQEALISSVGLSADLQSVEVAERLPEFLRLRGSSGIVRRFLAFYVFNVVWFQTADSFRLAAESQASFLDDMEQLEQTCRRIVNAAWRSRKTQGALPLASAEDLLLRIERRLQGSA